MARTSARARGLIELLLKEMQRGVKDPSYRKSEEWAEIYGSRQSLVVNLQKLVQALASLPDYSAEVAAPEAGRTVAPITPEELQQLTQWMQETR